MRGPHLPDVNMEHGVPTIRDVTESFADKLAYWRAHPLQVIGGGRTPSVRERFDRATGIRELRDTETGTSVYHHQGDDSRQDVTHRPETIRVTREDFL